jgi:hypothetical protein
MCCNFRQRKPAKGKGNAGQGSGPAQGQQPTQASQDQEPTQASQNQESTQPSQVIEPIQPSQVIESTQQSQVQDPTPPTQASQVVHPIQEPTDAVLNASQGSAENTTQSLFDDLYDEIMAAIPDVDASQCSQKNERTVKGKKDKMKRVSALYHGKQRRSSERVKQNAFKKPITGPGSSQEAPITITGQEDVADDSKLGTCFRAMKSWKDIPKKKK